MGAETRPDHPSNSTGGRASERAVEVAAKTFSKRRVLYAGDTFRSLAVPALEAAHDPALGEDRSVRLGDVLDALRSGKCENALRLYGAGKAAADYLAREFGADDHAR